MKVFKQLTAIAKEYQTATKRRREEIFDICYNGMHGVVTKYFLQRIKPYPVYEEQKNAEQSAKIAIFKALKGYVGKYQKYPFSNYAWWYIIDAYCLYMRERYMLTFIDCSGKRKKEHKSRYISYQYEDISTRYNEYKCGINIALGYIDKKYINLKKYIQNYLSSAQYAVVCYMLDYVNATGYERGWQESAAANSLSLIGRKVGNTTISQIYRDALCILRIVIERDGKIGKVVL